MINFLILSTIAFGLALSIAGFIAYAHDSILAKRAKPIPTFKLGFKIATVPQVSNVVKITPIRGLKAIASARSLTPITQQLFGKRYSLCNAEQLRQALTYAE